MLRCNPIKTNGLLVAQMLGVIACLAAIAIAPPARGYMMLVPLSSAARDQMVGLAIANGAQLVQAGPLPASLVVSGERSRLLGTLGAHNILVLAAGRTGCGTTPA